MRVLGLDISSSTIGWAILDDRKLIHADFIKPPKNGSIFSRLSFAQKEITKILHQHKPNEVVIENIVEFMQNKSQSKTIITLALFNRAVGLIAYEYLKRDPVLLHVASVRAALKPKGRKEKLKKEEIPELLAREFKIRLKKQYKKNGKIADETFDMADSIAVALAWVINQ